MSHLTPIQQSLRDHPRIRGTNLGGVQVTAESAGSPPHTRDK